MNEKLQKFDFKPLSHGFLEQPSPVKIEKVEDEAKNIKSFYFRFGRPCKAGQFLMLWIPGTGMKPMAVSYQKGELTGITMAAVGKFSKKMFELGEGDKIGLQGPYGTSFNLDNGKGFILVGGGYGTATMAFLADRLLERGKNVTMIIGARSKDYILYEKRLKKMKIRTVYCTDDGTYGEKGFATQMLEKLLEKEKPDCICACGPELMMKSVFEIAEKNNINCQLSIERYMKCGIGICGSCCVDTTGIRVCTEGTVIDGETARKIREFGVYHRDGTAAKHSF